MLERTRIDERAQSFLNFGREEGGLGLPFVFERLVFVTRWAVVKRRQLGGLY